MAEPKKIFISYNHKDTDKAMRVLRKLEELGGAYSIFFDRHSIEVGTRLSDAINNALQGANYYLILISENSNASEWVKRELSAAFEYSRKKSLVLVPFVIDGADVPLEFQGQLYIKASGDRFESGLTDLMDFFRRQISRGVEPPARSPKLRPPPQSCPEKFGAMEVGDLRYLLSQRLTVPDISVLWFDTFGMTMDREVAPNAIMAQICMALIDRSQREAVMPRLCSRICRNHPNLEKFANA